VADAPVWLTGVLCLVTGGTTGIGLPFPKRFRAPAIASLRTTQIG